MQMLISIFVYLFSIFMYMYGIHVCMHVSMCMGVHVGVQLCMCVYGHTSRVHSPMRMCMWKPEVGIRNHLPPLFHLIH